MTTVTLADVLAYRDICGTTDPAQRIIAYPYASPIGATLSAKLRLQDGGLACPRCGTTCTELHATRRGLICAQCERRLQSSVRHGAHAQKR